MFQMVPQNFVVRNNNSEAIQSFVTGSSKLLVPGKVTAATGIQQGAFTEPIEPLTLLGQPDIMQIAAQTNIMGVMELETKSKSIWAPDIHWVRALRLSDDCHSYNVILRLQPSQRPTNSSIKSGTSCSKLILQSVRPIELGQELLLWFSEDILAILQIAFLTPANIQGDKKYVCTKCSALYESPNPLKLHITLGCGRYTVRSLWEKLSASLQDNCTTKEQDDEVFDFKLLPEPQIMRQRNAMDLSISNTNHHLIKEENNYLAKELYKPYISSHESTSAFKPFNKSDNQLFAPVENTSVWPIISFDRQNYHMQQIANEDEAHIETLVSSLGKSKQGHICLYCGKCYSRKYGLKIHIRTHTGYKPLKCKYCLRPFGDPSNLNKHVRLHSEGNTPYKCDLCGKMLVRRRDLDRHLKSRHIIEMHPGMNLLPDESSNSMDKEVKVDEEVDEASKE